jgi:DNA-binding NarL/FixJ family response regulator
MIARPDDVRHRDDRIRVIVADGDGLARRMLRDALDGAEGITVVAEAGDAREALTLTRYHRPRVLLVDTELPPAGAVGLIGDVTAQAPETRVVMLAAREDDCLAVEGLRAGAAGHPRKDVPPATLPHIVGKACAGEAILPRRLTMAILERMREVPDAGWRPVRSRLTTREWEIVDLLGEAASTQDIADELVLSPTTVYSHVKSLLRKLGVHSRRDAVAVAERLRKEEVLGEKSPIGQR